MKGPIRVHRISEDWSYKCPTHAAGVLKAEGTKEIPSRYVTAAVIGHLLSDQDAITSTPQHHSVTHQQSHPCQLLQKVFPLQFLFKVSSLLFYQEGRLDFLRPEQRTLWKSNLWV